MAASKHTTVTAERARELIRYDPETGKLSWRVNAGSSGRIPAGTEAGSASGHGYWRIWVDGRKYFAHRLIWLIVTGAWPNKEIDHIDGNGLNNSWHNLREVSRTGNLRNAKRQSNNASGVTGISWHKASSKWETYIWVNGTRIRLGFFDNLPAAAEARKAAERRYGFHENHGRMS